MSKPETIINICSGIPIDNTYKHSLFFINSVTQNEYFSGKTVKRFSAYSYCRKNWEIKVDASMSEARQWCYLYFRNPDDNKYWYYFITDIQYISDESVRLTLELDVLQTYLFDMHVQPCFVERLTPYSDEIGENTVDEGLDVGTLTNNRVTDFDEIEELCAIVMTSERVSIDGTNYSSGIPTFEISKIFSGCYLIAIDCVERLGELLEKYSNAGVTDSIYSIWMYPKKLVKLNSFDSWDDYHRLYPEGEDGGVMPLVEGVTSLEYHINNVSDLNGYEPKNKKLFTYPYNFLYVTNNNGVSAEYRFERFSGTDKFFDVIGSPFADGGCKLVPRLYNGAGFNHDEGITLMNFPTVAFTGDYYKIWLAQNQNSYSSSFVSPALAIGGGVVSAVAGGFTMNPMMIAGGVGGVVGGSAQIGDLLAKKRDIQAQPNQARGNQGGSINACNSKQTFSFYYKSVTEETAKIIDNYFTMYGYKQNRVMNPSIHNRKRFTYVKTVDCLVAGDLCIDDRRKIGSIFDNGVTFWSDVENVGNYTTENGFLDD